MKVNKTKSVVVLGCLLVLAALVTLPGAAVAKEIPKGLVIGYNVSLLANGYHQADSTWAIKYAKEKGYWTDEAQAWHDKRLARLTAVRELWEETTAKFDEWRAEERKKGNKINAKEAWPDYWQKARDEKLK